MSFIFSHQLLNRFGLTSFFFPSSSSSVSFKHSQHSFITLANEFVLRNIRPQLLWQSRSCRRAWLKHPSSRRSDAQQPAPTSGASGYVLLQHIRTSPPPWRQKTNKKKTQKTKEKIKRKEIITTAFQSLTPKTRSGQYLQYKLQYNTLLKI